MILVRTGGKGLHVLPPCNISSVMAAVQRDWRALQYASVELRADQGVAMAAVQKGWQALQYASDELRADQGVVMAAITSGHRSGSCISLISSGYKP